MYLKLVRFYYDNVADKNKDFPFLIIQTVTETNKQTKDTGRGEKDDKGYEKKGMPLAVRVGISISTSPNRRTRSTIEKAHLVYLSVDPKMNLISMSTRQISVT